MINTLTITITESTDEPGFFYDIYDCEPDMVSDYDTDALDGGFCTTTIENTLEMATAQAQAILSTQNKK